VRCFSFLSCWRGDPEGAPFCSDGCGRPPFTFANPGRMLDDCRGRRRPGLWSCPAADPGYSGLTPRVNGRFTRHRRDRLLPGYETTGSGRSRSGRLPLRARRRGEISFAFHAGTPPDLSLSKAQMLFWTILLLVIFVSKSILDGAIWEVPWPLVALMGFSQAGYLAPKLVSQP